MGSATHLTDENGNVCNYYEYDAFGSFLTKAGNVPNRFCFAGEQYDPLTNQYYLRARFYNPAIGRCPGTTTTAGTHKGAHVRRGIEMKVWLTFVCMNLKKLAKIKAKWVPEERKMALGCKTQSHFVFAWNYDLM